MNELGLGGLIALTLQDSDSVERANKEIVRRLRQTPKKIGAPLYFLKVQKRICSPSMGWPKSSLRISSRRHTLVKLIILCSLGEAIEDLAPFDVQQYVEALFDEMED